MDKSPFFRELFSYSPSTHARTHPLTSPKNGSISILIESPPPLPPTHPTQPIFHGENVRRRDQRESTHSTRILGGGRRRVAPPKIKREGGLPSRFQSVSAVPPKARGWVRIRQRMQKKQLRINAFCLLVRSVKTTCFPRKFTVILQSIF